MLKQPSEMNSNVHSAVMKLQHHNAESQELSGDQSIEHLPESGSRARSADATASIENESTLSKWELGALVGTGAWSKSSTYIALTVNTGELLAVKQVHYANIRTENILEENKIHRMRRDLVLRLIDIVSRLDHPNVIRYIGDRLENNIHSISMEYLSGGSLRDVVRTYGKLGTSLVSNFTRQILLGLTYLHGQNIVHRALTIDKILLNPNGSCKISWSFKMAKVEDAYSSGAKDAVEGARYLLAPEVLRSHGNGFTAKAVSEDGT
jgi:mitogen-activated protein kinase kinase kinase